MKHILLLGALILINSFFVSCKKLIDIDPPKNKLSQETLFQSDDLATSVVTGIYSRMAISQGSGSIHHLCGLSADEFINYNVGFAEFYKNKITTISSSNTSLYSNCYSLIYSANALLEGLEGPNKVSQSIKKQLQGEALFIRAFHYFYLVNLYGPVPIQLITDYNVTRKEPRSSVDLVYKQIITDLKSSETLLTDTYITTDRVRPNLSTVDALLARVYLYTKDWANAEKYASLVISKSKLYNLEDPDKVFLKNSNEAIWQLFPPVNGNTEEGNFFILSSIPYNVSLSKDFMLQTFEINDKRKTNWTNSYTEGTETFFYPFKYKLQYTTAVTEYSMVLRLAEQFLIRAEARTQQDKLSNAIDDIDRIRSRAGLTLLRDNNPTISKADLLILIQKERKAEFFSEWGHRWFDLKRTNQINLVLSPIKINWKSTDALYPIPFEETTRNQNVKQNDGY